MTTEYVDHVDDQYSYALIGPLQEQVRVLENRAHHYVHHVRTSDEDRRMMEQVHELLAETRAQLEQLRSQADIPTT